ncbi:MAG: UDP-N-acetylmuramoyl-L-alanine--D-glutamate ligase [Verrucomicrobiae bacterium]|nr:UDP-N-acetylmuramoyl-L-alanine--D-glutamate ligase [Verrucomicrobiae bacterium]
MQVGGLKNKNVLVLGLGRSGMAAATLLWRDGANVVVRDEGDDDVLRDRAQRLRRLGVRVELGSSFDAMARFDLAVVSPGIGPERPIVQQVVRAKTPVLSELELAYRFCLCPIVAVTGTNGKTTTTELITWMLQHCGKRVIPAGNIGYALSEAAEQSAGLDALVVEVSSFQLEKIERFKPDIGIWLNLTPDHLDRHGTMEDYARAKARLFMNQDASNTAIVGTQALDWARKVGCKFRGRLMTFSADGQQADLWLDAEDGQTIWCWLPECRGVVLRMDETALRGAHNAENIMAAIAAGVAMGLPVRQIREAMMTYGPAPHRCEYVAEIGGVTYINDSKATNLDAVRRALETFDGRIVLIAGGRNKGMDFRQLRDVVARKGKGAVLIGETQQALLDAWGDVTVCVCAGSMEAAVRAAAELASAGDTVLLSPACASFDMFENYEHRGEEFKRCVLSRLSEAAQSLVNPPPTTRRF